MELKQQVFIETKDYSFSELLTMYNDGDLIPNPEWQRDYVYTDSQASKLIESAFLGIPIPPVYLCQENDETFSVIDGQQRITSIIRFLDNQFKLCKLDEITKLNGLFYKDLPKENQRFIKKKSLHAITILKDSQSLKYEIFARLNKGAVKLNPQELRNCIYRGSFNNLIEELATNKLLPELFHKENKRKSYQELILRFFALRNYMNYKGAILKTMNDFMQENQNVNNEVINKHRKLFNRTVDIIKQVLGTTAFNAMERDNGKVIISNKFGGAVYDSIIIPFSYFTNHDLMQHADVIRSKIEELKISNSDYQENTYAATGSRSRVIGRIQTVYNLLADITGSFGEDDNQRLFSNDIKIKLFKPGYICSYCGNEILSIEDAEVDHIIPFNEGGKTDISNAQLLHRHCNREKSDSLYIEENDTDALDEDINNI